MVSNNNELEKRLWDAADELRANSKLSSSQYSMPVLGLIFLRYADHRFTIAEQELRNARTRRRAIGKEDYQARGVLYLPEPARFSKLRETLTEGDDIGKAINDAMRAIEDENEELRDVLPKSYNVLDNQTLSELLRLFGSISMDVEGDVFGNIYEYFLSKFALAEGRGAGEFFTPIPIVRLIVDVIEPFHGRVYDPACGSGGMFVQSARFVQRHRERRIDEPVTEIAIYGQEKTTDTVRLCKMNLAVHGLAGDIREGNSYYEDIHESIGKFDFAMANPPFNVDRVDKERLREDKRFVFGLPKADNANYLWIQAFYSALNDNGRAGFVMANSASDARSSEADIRRKLIEARAVDAMFAIGPNFFYTVTLPVTLWFLDKAKATTDRRDKVLFVDARHTYRQIDRAHRDFSPEQAEFLANIVRLYRGETVELENGSELLLKEAFPDGTYRDVEGLCKVATMDDIAAQGWSLNPGRYVGISERDDEDFDFAERLEELNEELEVLDAEARELAERVAANISALQEASV